LDRERAVEVALRVDRDVELAKHRDLAWHRDASGSEDLDRVRRVAVDGQPAVHRLVGGDVAAGGDREAEAARVEFLEVVLAAMRDELGIHTFERNTLEL